jgi:hypothetical protein
MKKIIIVMLSFPLLCTAQQQTKSDTTLIKEASENYVEGFYTNDVERIKKSVHPELAKRLIVKDTSGIYMIRDMGLTELLFNARKFKRPESTTSEPFKVNVTICDISHDIAMAKVTQNKLKFFDYVQLGKINGEWKIINVLWAITK